MLSRYFARVTVCVVFAFSLVFPATVNFKGYTFEAYVAKSGGKRYKEFTETGRSMLRVRPNEEYSIVVRNPLPVRVAVAVSIDGLNSIDGKRTTLRNARKWIIEPKGTLTVAGWQTSKETLRKFVFTDQSESFAQWREDKEGKPLARNLGVIGVAWFWNSGELERALHPPEPFVEEQVAEAEAPQAARKAAPAAAKSAEARAGTGMGKQQQSHVTSVKFEDDAGMYLVKDVLKIFYEFVKEAAVPAPFIDDKEDDGRFTPEMPK
jgi:hypothetical protein